MPRKGPAPKRQVLPDSRYNSRTMARFINKIMLHECVDKFPTPSHQNILTRLLFQFVYFLHHILADNR